MPRAEVTPRLRLGIVTNEIFAQELGRMGGFGWAARQVSECFAQDSSLGVDAVLIMGEWLKKQTDAPATIHGSPVIWRKRNTFNYLAQLRRWRPDILLAIDYRPNYQLIFWSLPKIPVLIWVRDPWDGDDVERIRTLRIPGAEDQIPHGTVPPQTRSLSRVLRLSRMMRRPFRLAVTSPHLVKKIPGCYGVASASADILPNIISLQRASEKSKDPRVVFLARLDPTKRPWIFAELGRRFPECSFCSWARNIFRAGEHGTIRSCLRTCAPWDMWARAKKAACCPRRGFWSTPRSTKGSR